MKRTAAAGGQRSGGIFLAAQIRHGSWAGDTSVDIPNKPAQPDGVARGGCAILVEVVRRDRGRGRSVDKQVVSVQRVQRVQCGDGNREVVVRTGWQSEGLGLSSGQKAKGVLAEVPDRQGCRSCHFTGGQGKAGVCTAIETLTARVVEERTLKYVRIRTRKSNRREQQGRE